MKRIAIVLFYTLTLSLSLFSHPADPSSLLSKYAIYGEDSLIFKGKGVTPERGWIGSKSSVKFDAGAEAVTISSFVKAGGSFYAGEENKTYKDTVFVRGTAVTGKVSMIGALLKTNAVFKDPVLPKYPADSIKINPANDKLFTGKTNTLAPGIYGTVKVNGDADIVTLGAGIYQMDTLYVRGQIRVNHPVPGITRILVRSKVIFENAGSTLEDFVCEPSALGKVLIYCAGTDDKNGEGSIVIDDKERVTASVIAPFSNLEFRTHAVVQGQIFAKSITLSVDFTGYQSAYISFQPGNLIFPDSISAGVKEDLQNDPKKPNSRLLAFPLELGSPADSDGVVRYEIPASATLPPSASDELDFSRSSNGAAASGSLHFDKGRSQSRDSIKIWIIDDANVESPEHITVRLIKDPANLFSNGDPVIEFENDNDTIEYQIPILDDDVPGTLPYERVVNFPLTSVLEDPFNNPRADSSRTVSFPVTLSDTALFDGSLAYTVRAVSSKTPEAKETFDFSRTDSVGTITFKKGALFSADSIRLRIIDDAEYEPVEYIQVVFSSPDSVLFAGGKDTISSFISLISEDTAGTPAYPVTLQFPDRAVEEDLKRDPAVSNSRTVSFPLRLSGKTDFFGSVTCELLAVSPKTPAAEESKDFIRSLGKKVMSFPKKSDISPDSAVFTIIDDSEVEQDEYIAVVFTAADSVLLKNGQSSDTAYIRIISEDTAGTVSAVQTVLFPDSITAGVPEDLLNQPKTDNSRLLTFPLALTGTTKTAGTVDFEVLSVSTKSPSAVENSDFSRTANGAVKSGTLHFPAGASVSADKISIWIADDLFYEKQNEYISVKLSNPSGTVLANGSTEMVYDFALISEDDSSARIDTTVYRDSLTSGTAALFDLTGDGLGDRIELTMISSSQTASDIDSVIWAWNGSAASTETKANMTVLSPKKIRWSTDSVPGFGSGTAKVQLNDTLYFDAPAADSAGPALISGSADLTRDSRLFDTLLLTVTEPVSLSSGAWLILFKDSSSVIGDTVPVISSAGSGTVSLTAVLPKGKAAQGVWVQLNAAGSLKDLAGNAPAVYNRKVPLAVDMNRTPKFKSGALYDRFGPSDRRDGFGDSGFVQITIAPDTAAVTMDSLKSVMIGTRTFSRDSIRTADDSTIQFSLKSLAGDSITGSAAVILNFGSRSVSGILADSIAPAVLEAVYEKWPGGDSLQVTFTETVSKIVSAVPFSFYSSAAVSLKNVDQKSSVVRFDVVSGTISAGDSLWISALGGVADSSGTEQNWDKNSRVPVKFLQVSAPVKAWYTDENLRPDGTADHLTLITSKPISQTAAEAAAAKLTIPAHRGTVSAQNVTVHGDTVRFMLNDSGAVPNSAVNSDDLAGLAGQVRLDETLFYFPKSLPIEDSMAPVLLSASYAFGAEFEKADSVSDTLTVRYSERVTPLRSAHPFELRGPSGLYTLTLNRDLSGGETLSYVRMFRQDSLMPSQGDSIWIDEAGRITDLTGKEQTRDTKPVQLDVPSAQTEYDFIIYPNPAKLDAQGTVTNEYLEKLGENTSLGALIVTPRGIRPITSPGSLTARIVMHDAVGNRIFDLPAVQAKAGIGRDQVCTFELKNRLGRRLASGIYQVSVEITGAVTIKTQVPFGIEETAVNGQP